MLRRAPTLPVLIDLTLKTTQEFCYLYAEARVTFFGEHQLQSGRYPIKVVACTEEVTREFRACVHADNKGSLRIRDVRSASDLALKDVSI